MSIQRRKFLGAALGGVASLLLVPLQALAGRPQAFDQDSFDGSTFRFTLIVGNCGEARISRVVAESTSAPATG